MAAWAGDTIWSVSSGRRASPAAMDKQRPLTDAALVAFRAGVAAAGSALSASTRQDLTPLSAQLNSLAGIRTAADVSRMTPAQSAPQPAINVKGRLQR